ncbi:thioredoxin domain-containing protein [Gillisia hiemivivida]|uniref:Thioredoxin domain-containing protein n=1 Tax=Gillisia hiemivivida TaxID=291190 RepID=A0A5C6ZZ91_9FLAO|nr:thioredoxin domain-containing protein [Gillisia hiemivivida]TXD94713.1 thioredoxin domain-containing protein [Gillisia hiemivivida]
MKSEKHTNSLIQESSPYLLQHAHNPVNWYPWGSNILEKAVADNKLIIISVGYAACHWCHVMEHESFEDEDVAEIMNSHYYNIKVDREERPDLDMVYMSAVQIMTGSGGWPMNIVALPDGRPVWGGTYFKKDTWKSSLLQIAKLYKENPEKLHEYADKLSEGLKSMQLIPESSASENDISLDIIIEKLEKNFDWKYGGTKQVPKFVIPANFEFLLKYAQLYKKENVEEFVKLSLTKISFGGIYDHIEGGFSRYSVDEKWHIPHFEKMLYDNAQMVSLYSKAYALTNIDWYREVVEQSLEFIKNNLTTKEGSFYSSLDADSINKKGQLKEGAFYTWEIDELKELLNEEFPIFKEYYNINSYGKWENNEYVLIRTQEDTTFLEEHKLNSAEFRKMKDNWSTSLSSKRNTREKPRLDDKQLTSWNALMLSGYVDAYKITHNEDYLAIALKNAYFIKKHLYKTEGNLQRSFKNGESSINGYLEDYAFLIEACIKLYEVTFDFNWLTFSKDLIDCCIQNFHDPKSGLFYFTSKQDQPLITRNYELSDNVIPASNSVMAQNLFKLSKYFGQKDFLTISEKMLTAVTPQLKDYPQGYSNWLSLKLNFSHNFYDVVIMGPNAKDLLAKLHKAYLPNILIAGSTVESNSSPLFQNRFKEGEDLIYVCTNGTCQLPVKTITSVLELIK